MQNIQFEKQNYTFARNVLLLPIPHFKRIEFSVDIRGLLPSAKQQYFIQEVKQFEFAPLNVIETHFTSMTGQLEEQKQEDSSYPFYDTISHKGNSAPVTHLKDISDRFDKKIAPSSVDGMQKRVA